MSILVFAATTSQSSINFTLAQYAASLISDYKMEFLDLNDYELSLFSVDKEKEQGIPTLAQSFYDSIGRSQGVIVSFAEHNGYVTAAYKNLFDWTSRIHQKVFQGKPCLFLSTSPGAEGAAGTLELVSKKALFFAAEIKGSFSLPYYQQNFDREQGIVSEPVLRQALQTQVDAFQRALDDAQS